MWGVSGCIGRTFCVKQIQTMKDTLKHSNLRVSKDGATKSITLFRELKPPVDDVDGVGRIDTLNGHDERDRDKCSGTCVLNVVFHFFRESFAVTNAAV